MVQLKTSAAASATSTCRHAGQVAGPERAIGGVRPVAARRSLRTGSRRRPPGIEARQAPFTRSAAAVEGY